MNRLFCRRLFSTTSTDSITKQFEKAVEPLSKSIERIYKLSSWQVGFTGLGLIFAGVNTVANYGHAVPVPAVYVKSSVKGGPTDSLTDPVSVVKFRNNGGNEMTLASIHIEANGEKIDEVTEDTISKAIGAHDSGCRFEVSTVSESLFETSNRSIAGKSSSVALFYVRPKTPAEANEKQWEKDFRAALKARKIVVVVSYNRYRIPVIGPFWMMKDRLPLE